MNIDFKTFKWQAGAYFTAHEFWCKGVRPLLMFWVVQIHTEPNAGQMLKHGEHYRGFILRLRNPFDVVLKTRPINLFGKPFRLVYPVKIYLV